MSNKSTKKELLDNLGRTFSNGIRSGKANTPREHIESHSLDFNKCNLGFNSGQFHHREDKEFKQNYVEIGMLVKSNVGVNAEDRVAYTCKGSYGISYPLLDESGDVVNFYFDRFKLTTPKTEYLYQNEGIYPSYPDSATKTLFLCFNPIDTASLITSNLLDNKEAVISLFDGGLSEEQENILERLSELEEIIHITSSTSNDLLESIQTELPNVKLSKVELPESHTLNDMLVNYGAEAIQELLQDKQSQHIESELEIISPIKIHFKGLEASYDIVGNLPMDMSHFKVSLHITNPNTNKKTRHTVNLYDSRQISKLCLELAEKHHYNGSVLESDLLKLTDLLEQHREKIIEEEDNEQYINKSTEELTPLAERTAIEYLQATSLFSRLDTLIEQSGIVGEELSRMHLFLIGSSYKSVYPLHGLVQSQSGGGKSHLINGIANLLPQEDVFNVSSVTARSFNYYNKGELMDKCIIIQDWEGLEEDAQYSFRELQSAKFINTSTITKNKFGQLTSTIKKVTAHFSSLMATTKAEIYHDNVTRSIIIGVDESLEQTEKITDYQNRKFTGEIDYHKQEKAKQLIRNCIRVLKPTVVINPFARTITLPVLPNHRRLNEQFNSYVSHITYLHQFQREKDEQGRIIASLEDIKQAIRLFFPSLILKIDELNSSSRYLFEKLKKGLSKSGSGKSSTFSKQDFMQISGLKSTRAYQTLKQLHEIGFINVSGGSKNKGFIYQISDWNDGLDEFKTKLKKGLESQLSQATES